MHIAYTPEERALQAEIAAYLAEVVTPDMVKAFSSANFSRELYREVLVRIGRDGWLSRGWPVEHGGRSGSAVEQYIFFNEARKASVPLPYLTINSVAPAIMRFGTPDQQRRLLPSIAGGRTVFGIGYSEPDAGTDLAALATAAVRNGDDYVVNGQKIWTSLAHLADYIWLAVRTSPDKHAGITMLIVPTDTPGFSITPIQTMGDYRTNTCYFDDVRVPVSARVGKEGDGWHLITSQLQFERVALSNPGYIETQLREVHRWAAATHDPQGRRLLDLPRVRDGLARVYVIHESLKLLNWKLADAIDRDGVDAAQSSVVKVFGTESSLDAYRELLDILEEDGYVKALTPGAVIGTDLEKAYRRDLTFTFGGGANEVQRQIIARAAVARAGG